MQKLELENNKLLSWSEYGTPDGEPVIYFHGMPGSRIEAKAADAIAKELGLRLITPERPSYGDSGPQENFKPLDWPVILSQFLQSLNINQFSILSFSAGGLYALACAHALPDQIKHITLVSAPAPFETDAIQNTISPDIKPLYELAANNYDIAIEQVSQLVTSPKALIGIVEATLPTEDKEIFNDKYFCSQYLDNMTLAIKNGITGFVNDQRCIALPWGFEPETIENKVDIWHGLNDKTVDIAVAEYLADSLKNSTTHFLNGTGHFLLFNQWREVLENIKSDIT